MAVDKLIQFYGKVMVDVDTDTVATPIFCGDCKSIEVSLITSDPASDFTFLLGSSIQKLPPDFSGNQSADNQFAVLAYIDESNGATYNDTSPYNPASEGGAVSKVFRSNTNGAQWLAVAALNFAGGSITGVNVTLSDNL